MWTKVSLKEAKMRATPKTSSVEAQLASKEITADNYSVGQIYRTVWSGGVSDHTPLRGIFGGGHRYV